MTCLNESVLGAALSLLGNLMVERKRPPLHLVICGGSALIALKLVARTTQAVDVLAIVEGGQLRCARPLPPWLLEDAGMVQEELTLSEKWLCDGPARQNLYRFGLPEGVADRLVIREYGPLLKLGFVSRFDQIHFKLFAAADLGGEHFTDLRKLDPTAEELRLAALWIFTQDDSPGYREIVVEVLKALGHVSLLE